MWCPDLRSHCATLGSSWGRKVYERIDTPSCNAVGIVTIASCLNEPNSPEVRNANSGVSGDQSSVAGEVISVSVQTTPMTGVNRPTEGSASARGVSDFGVNKLEVRADGGFAREVFFPNSTIPDDGVSSFTEGLGVGAGAQSAWWTRFTPDFSGSMSFGLSTFRHGAQASLGTGDGISSREATLRFGVHDLTEQQCYAIDFWYDLDPTCPSPFDRRAAWVGGLQRDNLFAFGSSPFSLTIDVVAGRTDSMSMNLFLYVENSGILDFFGTSRLDFIEIPNGGAVDFAAGAFAVRTALADDPSDEPIDGPGDGPGDGPIGGPIDGPGDGTGDGPVRTVPEPSTWLLAVTGATLLLLSARQSKRGVFA